ncbi:MAG: NADP-dependent oxidoreductase [Acidiferrobacterales bacterium]|nr:NADP-dependent oxidoreductase [Acidiferrobacterales bacterium]
MIGTNHSWVLASYPEGMPDVSNWRLETSAITTPDDGQVLARALYLSVDPYMRGRISSKRGYAKGVELGDVMIGGAVAEVIESKHPQWNTGDLIESFNFGWQEYSILDPETATRVDPDVGPPHAWLSYIGMPGITAWCALRNVGNPVKGDTVLISAASGAVGQVAGQLAKAAGCRAVAVASADSKLDWCRKLGYDAGVNYRSATNLTEEIAAACPDGIDIFFDNTAGPIHDAAMKNLALGARIIVCGTISLADKFDAPDMGERFLRQILVSRAKVSGFLVFDHLSHYDTARRELADLASNGKLRFKTDFMDGIQNMPAAFLKLLHSENMGKQLIRTEFAKGLPE